MLKFDCFDDVIKLLEQCNSDGIQPDLVLYNTILHGASDQVMKCLRYYRHSQVVKLQIYSVETRALRGFVSCELELDILYLASE